MRLLLVVLLAAGCDAPAASPPVPVPPRPVAVGPSTAYRPYLQNLLLPDGRVVPCILVGTDNGAVAAMSCDWARASK